MKLRQSFNKEYTYFILKIKVSEEGVAIYAHNPIGFYRVAQTLHKALHIVNEGGAETNGERDAKNHLVRQRLLCMAATFRSADWQT